MRHSLRWGLVASAACARLVHACVRSTVGKTGSTLTYTAAPTRELNNLVISETATQYIFFEANPAVTPSASPTSGCTTPTADDGRAAPRQESRLSTIDLLDLANAATQNVALPTTFIGGSVNDDFTGGGANDTFTLGTGSNEASGGGGNDVFNSSTGADTLIGGTGDDVFKQGTAADGTDTLTGNSGTDTVEYNQRTAPLTIAQDDNAGDGAAGENDKVNDDIEIVRSGSGADSVSGDACDSVIYGGGGNDTLNGSVGGLRSCLGRVGVRLHGQRHALRGGRQRHAQRRRRRRHARRRERERHPERRGRQRHASPAAPAQTCSTASTALAPTPASTPRCVGRDVHDRRCRRTTPAATTSRPTSRT